ncbi:hypothetical protein CEXT_577921 [Caerostris extrusa]|uniref:Uncharacterized protein n=1 Tax=Caerostris extrusa TaxID=172846 RepID=A0AAV4WM02_CAEEX|nr:hypothetical protein CEXT_577921 [Caerostris extrusa]
MQSPLQLSYVMPCMVLKKWHCIPPANSQSNQRTVPYSEATAATITAPGVVPKTRAGAFGTLMKASRRAWLEKTSDESARHAMLGRRGRNHEGSGVPIFGLPVRCPASTQYFLAFGQLVGCEVPPSCLRSGGLIISRRMVASSPGSAHDRPKAKDHPPLTLRNLLLSSQCLTSLSLLASNTLSSLCPRLPIPEPVPIIQPLVASWRGLQLSVSEARARRLKCRGGRPCELQAYSAARSTSPTLLRKSSTIRLRAGRGAFRHTGLISSGEFVGGRDTLRLKCWSILLISALQLSPCWAASVNPDIKASGFACLAFVALASICRLNLTHETVLTKPEIENEVSRHARQ